MLNAPILRASSEGGEGEAEGVGDGEEEGEGARVGVGAGVGVGEGADVGMGNSSIHPAKNVTAIIANTKSNVSALFALIILNLSV
jgi:hypothetical protein